MNPALAIVEFDSITHGIVAGDAMAKRAPLQLLRAGTVHPGRYLLLAGGGTGEVEEALDAARSVGAPGLLGWLLLPDVHPQVVAAIGGARQCGGDALGIIETATVTDIVQAADAGLKNAEVVLRELRLADELGGKGYLLFGGGQTEIEAAIEHALARLEHTARPPTHAIIARLHPEMDDNLRVDARFAPRVAEVTKTDPAAAGRRNT